MDMQISSDLRRLFRQHQLPNDKEMEIATFKIFFYPHKFLAKKKKERCLMITESKLRILTNNPRGDRSRDEVIKKRQLIKNICAFTTSENSNQIVIHFHQNIDESDWQIECQYKTIVFDTLVKVYYQKKKERITCFIMQEKSLDRFVTTREIKKNNKNNMPVHEKQGKKTILFLPEEEIKQENVHSSEILFNLDKLTKLGLISESEKSKVYLVKYGEKSTNKFALKEIKASDCKISEKIQLQIKDNSYKLKLPKNCPFLIQLLYTSEDNGNLFFLMPYFNKGDLQMHLSKNNKFTEDQVRFFAVEICLALEEFHSRGVVYKDLIPENILINDKGHVFLTDFGNARFNILQDDHQPPDTIITCYTAPEVLKGEDYSKLSDYWCFGVLLYELLTGVPPFYSENLELQYKLILKLQKKIIFLKMSKSDSEPSQQYSEAEEQEQPLNSEKVKKDIIHAIQKPIVENNIQEKQSITALKDKKIDEAIYKKKKRKTAPKDDKLDEDQLEKLAIASIDAVQEQLNKLQKEERENAIAMKLKYPRRFCIVHLDLYDEEEEYIKHMIRNHKLLAKKENLIKFQCNECGDVYATVGKLNLHDCKGFQQYIKETNKLTPKQKKLAKLSTQLNYQQ